MNNQIKLAIIFLLAIVVTITAMIAGAVYDNNQNIGRDKFYAEHCQFVKQEVDSSALVTTKQYNCEH